jgi:hypothetical protein
MPEPTNGAGTAQALLERLVSLYDTITRKALEKEKS